MNLSSRSRISALACLLLLVSSFGCARADLKRSLQSQTQGIQREPIILAAYQPWFGRTGHVNIGYSSQDSMKIREQIEQATNLGIAGFVVNWYGPRHQFEDTSYKLMQEIANGKDFKVAIMYDEDDSDPRDSTEAVIVDLQYAYDRYIGPQSQVKNDSYLHYDGRPVIFIFPKGSNTDWKRVRATVQSWEQKPLLIYKDPSAKWKDAFDGFYAWVAPGKKGWQPDGSNWGQEYLEDFYLTMNNSYPDKLAVGAAWPGFNDSRASWARNRKMDSRCGKTFEESLRIFRRYYDDKRPLPFLMIDTWNDYEEGTAIESGSSNCGKMQQPISVAGRE